LFDLDGTLMLSDGSGRRAFERALEAVLGVERALAGITLHGNTDPAILDEACAATLGRAATAVERTAVLARYLDFLAEELARPGCIRVLPAVRETLAALAAHGALVGLATGNIEAGARLKLDAAGLADHFTFGGYGSDAAERSALVEVAIARGERLAGRAVPRDAIRLVGDTPRDIAAARATRVRAIGVTTGIHDAAALREAGADEVHATLATLLG
jgi:phosphoglycolate phosphatase-like HAD superfamily hydrolase